MSALRKRTSKPGCGRSAQTAASVAQCAAPNRQRPMSATARPVLRGPPAKASARALRGPRSSADSWTQGCSASASDSDSSAIVMGAAAQKMVSWPPPANEVKLRFRAGQAARGEGVQRACRGGWACCSVGSSEPRGRALRLRRRDSDGSNCNRPKTRLKRRIIISRSLTHVHTRSLADARTNNGALSAYLAVHKLYSPSHPARGDQAVLPAPRGRQHPSSQGGAGLGMGRKDYLEHFPSVVLAKLVAPYDIQNLLFAASCLHCVWAVRPRSACTNPACTGARPSCPSPCET